MKSSSSPIQKSYRFLGFSLSLVAILPLSSLFAAAPTGVPYPSATPGGIFSQYFTNMIQWECPVGESIIGYDKTPGTSYGTRLCGKVESFWKSNDSGNNIFFTGAGNVGIGTNNPRGKLHIYRDTNAGVGISVGTPGTQSMQQAVLNLITKDDNSTNFESTTNRGWTIYGRGDAYSYDGDVGNRFGISFWDGTQWNPYFSLSANGKMGIGTTTPWAKLHVYSGALIVQNNDTWSTMLWMTTSNIPSHTAVFMGLRARWTEAIPAFSKNGDPLALFEGRDALWNASGPASYGWAGMHIFASEDQTVANKWAGIEFHTTTNGTNFPHTSMTIQNNGNVGIGTNTPSQKLDVNGGMRMVWSEIINNASPTIFFQDTDNRSAMIHTNSNYMYFLRWAGNNAMSWTSYNGMWPFILNLETNDATFGGSIWSKNSIYVDSGALMSNWNTNEGWQLNLMNGKKIGSKANQWSLYNMTGPYGDGLGFYSYPADGTTGGCCHMNVFFNDNGNVGIGVGGNPGAKLDVGGNIKTNIFTFDGNDDTWLRLRDWDGGAYRDFAINSLWADAWSNLHGTTVWDTDYPTIALWPTNPNATKYIGIHMDGAGWSPSNEFRLGRYNRSPAAWQANPVRFDIDAPDSSLYMDGAGKVGIGTSSPWAKLDVNGEIKSATKITTPELCLNGTCKTNWSSGGGGGGGVKVLTMGLKTGSNTFCFIADSAEQEVYCWGEGNYGQHGLGNNVAQNIPRRVPIISGITQLTYNAYLGSCALKNDGTVWCWGYNDYGEIGDNTYTNAYYPKQVSGLTSVKKIVSGHEATCALKTDGTVWCWGRNRNGNLGDNSTTYRNVPVKVVGLTNATDIASNDDGKYPAETVCALKTNGTVWCWGYNGYGQLGNGNTTQALTPVQFGTFTDVVKIEVGGSYGANTCVLRSNNQVWCAGYNAYGQLGDGTTIDRSVPVRFGSQTFSDVFITHLSHYTNICGIEAAASKRVFCAGYNGYGQIGDGTTTNRSTPTVALGLSNVKKVSIHGQKFDDNGNFLCAVTYGNDLYCWGYGALYNLGNGANLAVNSTPTKVVGLDGKVDDFWLTGYNGYNEAFAKTTDGNLYYWGRNVSCGSGDGCAGGGVYQQIPRKVELP